MCIRDSGVDCTVGANVVFARQDAEEPAEIEIGDHVYIGSNSTLVAPLTLGTNTMVAAGSVVTESVPDNALAIGRSRIEIKEDWMRRPR